MKPVSFTDPHGAAITVPAEQLALYATIKTEQLDVLNSIIADQTAGFDVVLTENIISQLACLAKELSNTTKHLVVAITEDGRAIPATKEGAQ